MNSNSGLLTSAQFIGNFTGLPFTPFASDLYGRRAALFFGSVIMLVGVGLQAAAWSVPMFIGARYCSKYTSLRVTSSSSWFLFMFRIVGFGLSFCQNAAPLLLIELSYPTQVRFLRNDCDILGSGLTFSFPFPARQVYRHF